MKFILIFLIVGGGRRASSLRSFPHWPVTSCLLGPNVLLGILLSDPLNIYSSFTVRFIPKSFYSYAPIKSNENSEITQFRVTIATNFPALTCCMNVKLCSGSRTTEHASFPVYRVYSECNDIIFMWICEMQYTIQDVRGGRVSIPGGHSIGHSK
jgi:hypothetical protein